MTVLDRLASASGRKDEAPNQKLAQEIVDATDRMAVKELVDNLSSKNKSVQSDCIKVLYEIGERDPELISVYHENFGRLLQSGNNRLAWGGMTALDSIAAVSPKAVYGLLPKIIKAAEVGSVITRDHAVGILVKLASQREYARQCFPLLLEQLRNCPDNQFPMYAEMSLTIINQANKTDFVEVVARRARRLEKESQRKRIGRVLSQLSL